MQVSTSCIFAPTIEPRSIDFLAHFLTARPIICIGSTNSGNPTAMRHSVGSMWFETANQTMYAIATSISNGASATSVSIVVIIVWIVCGSATIRISSCPMSTRPKNWTFCLCTCSRSSCLRSATACEPDHDRQ